MSKENNVMSAYETVQKAIADLKMKHGELLAKKKVLLDNKNEIYRLPLPKEDIKQFIFEWVDRMGQMYMKRSSWPGQVRNIANPPRQASYTQEKGVQCKQITLLDVEDAFSSTFDSHGSLPSWIFGGSKFDFIEAPDDFGFWFFMFGDIVKKKIEEHFDDFLPDCDIRESNPTIKQRREKFAVIDAEVMALDKEMFNINEQLRGLGQKV